MNQHRIGTDAHRALSEIARLSIGAPAGDPRCVETEAPLFVLRDLRTRRFIDLMITPLGKTAAVLLDAGRAYLDREGDVESDADTGPARRRVFTDRDALAFAR